MTRRFAVGQRYAVGQGASGRMNLIGSRFAVGHGARSNIVGQGTTMPGSGRGGFSPTIYEIDESNANAARRLPLGFGTTTIAAGASATVTASPQVLFRGERLVIPSSIAPSVRVNDIIIGNRTQTAAAGAVNGSTYSEVAVGTGLLLDTAQPGIDVQLLVTNTSADAISFSAVLLGAAVVGSP